MEKDLLCATAPAGIQVSTVALQSVLLGLDDLPDHIHNLLAILTEGNAGPTIGVLARLNDPIDVRILHHVLLQVSKVILPVEIVGSDEKCPGEDFALKDTLAF